MIHSGPSDEERVNVALRVFTSSSSTVMTSLPFLDQEEFRDQLTVKPFQRKVVYRHIPS